jgi:hypothetical protein
MFKSLKLYLRIKKLEKRLQKQNKRIDYSDDIETNTNVLIIDVKIPEYNKDSGSRRLTEIIKILRKNNIGVFLMADLKEYRYNSDYIDFFREMGVVVYEPAIDSFNRIIKKDDFLKMVMPKVNYVWMHRPEIFEKYCDIVKRYNEKVKLFFDMVDFHYLRFKREYELNGDRKILLNAEKYLKMELENCRKADKIIVISDTEKETLKSFYEDDSKTVTIGNIHQFIKNENKVSFVERKGLLFIGGFDHRPNVDAVEYLHKEIMPLIWKSNPDISISIIGSNPPDSISSLHSDKFKIEGYIKDVEPYFQNAKIFVAPLRYGAGIKGKIGQSLEYGLPLVTTDIGAEGFDFGADKSTMTANTAQQFVDNILMLNQNEDLWNSISLKSESILIPFSYQTIESRIMSLV